MKFTKQENSLIKLEAAHMAPQMIKKATLQDKLAEYGIGLKKQAADADGKWSALALPKPGIAQAAPVAKPDPRMKSLAEGKPTALTAQEQVATDRKARLREAVGKYIRNSASQNRQAGLTGYAIGQALRGQQPKPQAQAPVATETTAAQPTPAAQPRNSHYDKAPNDPSRYINMDLGYAHTAANIPLQYYNTTGKWNDYRPGELPWQNVALEKVREIGEASEPYGASQAERRAAGKSYVDAMNEAEQQRQFLQNRQKLGEQIRDNIRAQGAMPIPDPYVRMENEWSPGKGYENDSFGWQNPLAGKGSLHPGLLNSGTELYGDRARDVNWNWRGFPDYPEEGAYNWNRIKGNAGLVPVERER